MIQQGMESCCCLPKDWHTRWDSLGDGCSIDFPLKLIWKLKWSPVHYRKLHSGEVDKHLHIHWLSDARLRKPYPHCRKPHANVESLTQNVESPTQSVESPTKNIESPAQNLESLRKTPSSLRLKQERVKHHTKFLPLHADQQSFPKGFQITLPVQVPNLENSNLQREISSLQNQIGTRLRNLVLKHYKNLANTIEAKIESNKKNMFSKAEATNLPLKDKGLEGLKESQTPQIRTTPCQTTLSHTTPPHPSPAPHTYTTFPTLHARTTFLTLCAHTTLPTPHVTKTPPPPLMALIPPPYLHFY